jgi:hypothetical protein
MEIMENSERLDPNESLDIISDAIQKTKENIKEQSFYYLLWGWLASIAAIMNYIILNFTNFVHHWLPWAILMPLGGIVAMVYSIKNNNKKSYETYLDVFLKYLWISIGVSFILAVFMSLILNISPAIIVLLLAGIGTLISGLVMKFKPLILGGILFFVFSLTSVFVDDSFKLLIFAIAITIGYLTPAYILKRH